MMRDPSGFIPSPMDRYRKILLPALRLFQVILTSTTMNHQQGAAQVSKDEDESNKSTNKENVCETF